ncbi:hypothetical protein BC829DRAFT_429375 [Chytridium lagenaria]|nr:hypothetical protein BC829DRAFT_429375 [Chytridium lagenaria]
MISPSRQRQQQQTQQPEQEQQETGAAAAAVAANLLNEEALRMIGGFSSQRGLVQSHPDADGLMAASAAAAAAVAAMEHRQQQQLPQQQQSQEQPPQLSTATTPADIVSTVMTRHGRKSVLEKPAIGTDEWLRQRRDNHKQVEKRRRETINEGILELAKLVPDGDKNKGRVIQRAIVYITQLRQNEAAQLEKWTLEKLLCEQAIQELHNSVDKYRAENETLKKEMEKLAAENKQLKQAQEWADDARMMDE